MKKLKILAASLVLTTAFAGVVFAEEGTVSADVSITAKINALKAEKELILKTRASTTAEIKARVQKEAEMMRMKIASTSADIKAEKGIIKARIASTTERIKEFREEKKSDIEMRIGKKLDEERAKIAQRFEEAIKTLSSLVARIESRIGKIEAEGGNTTASKTLLVTAKANVTIANTELTNLENLLAATSTASSTRKATLASIKTQSEKTKKAVETARQSIIRVINSLKPGQALKKVSATTTTTVSATTTVQQ